MFCNKCGAQIDDDSVFCNRCGNKIPSSALAIDDEYEYEDEAKYSDNIRDDYEYESDEDLISFKFMGVDFNFPYDYTIAANAADTVLDAFYLIREDLEAPLDRTVGSIEATINEVLPIFLDGYNLMIEACHKALLMEDCLDVSIADIQEFANELCIPFLLKSLNPYIEAGDKLAEVAETLHSYRSLQRASRGRWQGGGFGLGGAIKGAINAGILNAGTSLIRNIGDSITDSRDRQEYKKLDSNLYYAIKPLHHLNFILAKLAAMLIKVLHITMQNNGVFECIMFDSQELSALDKECSNRCKILQQIDTSKLNAAHFWNAYSNRIRAYPFEPSYYVSFVRDAHFDYKEMRNIHDIVGIGVLAFCFEQGIVLNDSYDVMEYSEKTKADIQHKISELQWLSSSDTIDGAFDSEISRLKNKLSQMR